LVEALGSRRKRSGSGGNLFSCRRPDGHEYMQALGPAGFDGGLQSGFRERLTSQLGGRYGERERVGVWWIYVEYQMRRAVPFADLEERRVILHGTLIGEPEQGPAVVAEPIGDLSLRGLGPQRRFRYPRRGVLGEVLLHERRLTAQHPDHGQRPVRQSRDNSCTDGVEVLDKIPLGRVGALEQRLIEIGQLDPVTYLVLAHRLILHLAAPFPATSGPGCLCEPRGFGAGMMSRRVAGIMSVRPRQLAAPPNGTISRSRPRDSARFAR